MKKVLRILALLVIAGGVGFLQLWSMHDADVANQKTRSEGIMVELVDNINLIEANLRSVEYDGEGEWSAKYAELLTELEAIPYAVENDAELIDKLRAYESQLRGRVMLAEDLKTLRGLVAEFSEKMNNEIKDAKVTKDLFSNMKGAFEGFGGSLPEADDSLIGQMSGELRKLSESIAAVADSTANCVNVCAPGVIEGHVSKLEDSFKEAGEKVGEINGRIITELRNEDLVNWLIENINSKSITVEGAI